MALFASTGVAIKALQSVATMAKAEIAERLVLVMMHFLVMAPKSRTHFLANRMPDLNFLLNQGLAESAWILLLPYWVK